MTVIAVIAVLAVIGSLVDEPSTVAESGSVAEVGSPEDSATDPEPEEVAVVSLTPGDCFDKPGADEVVNADIVPCTQPHFGEAYTASDLSSPSTYPGDEQVRTEAEAGCVERFEEFATIPYSDSSLQIYFFHPTKSSCPTYSDRVVTCAAYDPAGDVTVPTLRGSGR